MCLFYEGFEMRAMPAGTRQSSLLVSADRRNPQRTKPPMNQRAEGNQLPPTKIQEIPMSSRAAAASEMARKRGNDDAKQRSNSFGLL